MKQKTIALLMAAVIVLSAWVGMVQTSEGAADRGVSIGDVSYDGLTGTLSVNGASDSTTVQAYVAKDGEAVTQFFSFGVVGGHFSGAMNVSQLSAGDYTVVVFQSAQDKDEKEFTIPVFTLDTVSYDPVNKTVSVSGTSSSTSVQAYVTGNGHVSPYASFNVVNGNYSGEINISGFEAGDYEVTAFVSSTLKYTKTFQIPDLYFVSVSYDPLTEKLNVTGVSAAETVTMFVSGEGETSQYASYPVRDGTFSGQLDLSKFPVGKYIATVFVSSDNKDTAEFIIPNLYTVKFVTEHGTAPKDLSAYEESTIELSSLTAEGYTFVGWKSVSGTYADKYTLSPADASESVITLTAVWAVNQYSITFDTDGGSAVDPITQDYGTAIVVPEEPTKTGYTFSGWNPALPETMPAENMTVKAVWTPIAYGYTVNYVDADGKTVRDAYTSTADYGTEVTPEAVAVAGYTAPDVQKITITDDASKNVVTYVYKINQYTITFDTDGGSAVASITQDYGTAVTAPDAPTKSGYIFGGWDSLPATMPAENITVKAVWKADVSITSATYDKANARLDISGTYLDDGTVQAFVTDASGNQSTYASYTASNGRFSGQFDLSSYAPGTYTLTVFVSSDIKDTAEFVIPVKYTVSFVTERGTAPASVSAFEGDPVALSAIVSEGYAFNGWQVGGKTYTGSYMVLVSDAVNTAITLTAIWTVNQYTITFDTDGGSAVASITQDYGTAVTAPAVPTKVGHTFSGWDALPTTMPAENVTVKALWKVNQYTIAFDTDGGTVVDSITQDYGTEVVAPASPTKTGYTFSGWATLPEMMPAEDTVVKAIWTINQYTITFDTDGGSAVAPITQDYGTVVSVTTVPTRAGYAFAGWSSLPATMPAENITVKALWTSSSSSGLALTSAVYDADTERLTVSGTYSSGGNLQAYVSDSSGTMVSSYWTVSVRDGVFSQELSLSGYKSGTYSVTVFASSSVLASLNFVIPSSVQSYTVIYMVDGEQYGKTQVYEEGATVTLIGLPAVDGYNASSWSSTNVSISDGKFVMPAENVVFVSTLTKNASETTTETDDRGNTVTTTTVTTTNDDGYTKTETTTETKGADGNTIGTTVVTTETNPDGSTVETKTETTVDSIGGTSTQTTSETKNASGETVSSTSATSVTKADGSTSSESTTKVNNADGSTTETRTTSNTDASGSSSTQTAVVTKDSSGKTTGASTKTEEKTSAGTVTTDQEASYSGTQIVITYESSDVSVDGTVADSISSVLTMPSTAVSDTDGLSYFVTKVDSTTLSDSVRDKVGNGTVYNLTLSNSSGTVTAFSSPVTVSITYTVPEGVNGNVEVWHISDDGFLELVESTYSDGSVQFQTSHFSYYAILVAEDDDDDDNTVLIVALIIVAILLIIGLAYFLYRRKNAA